MKKFGPDLERLLQEIASAQEWANVVASCARLNNLIAKASPQARERLRESVVDLAKELSFLRNDGE